MAPIATNDTNGPSKPDFTTFHNIINGQLKSTKTTRHGINPANLKENPEVPVSTEEDVEAAIKAGKEAFKTWSKTSAQERKKIANKFADAIDTYKHDFAKMLTQENGKPLAMATKEVGDAANILRALASMELKEEVAIEDDTKKTIVRYTPLGLVVGIVPWNFPVILTMPGLASSILTGNTYILKPSPYTPYCCMKLAELAQQFFPPGVVSALSGDDNLGPWLTEHPGPDKIHFTGSTATGKRVMASAAKTLKRVTLELGGNDPAIVCADVDIDAAAPKVAAFALANSGQICMAIKRVYVHESIKDKFVEAMGRFVQSLKIGDGTEDGVFIGPIQNSMQYEKVKDIISDIDNKGYKVAVKGASVESEKGYFISPSIIDGPPEDARITVEEQFAPIIPVMAWTSEKDVIERANNTKMGLGASVWSSNLDQAERIARQLEAGNVWINTHLIADPRVPYSGHKESGIGSEYGLAGLKHFCNVQTLTFNKS